MADTDILVRVADTEAIEILRKIANDDMRSMGNEVAWLIRQEWARRNTTVRGDLITTTAQAQGSKGGE